MTRVTVTIPATTANLGPGFDCLGLALGLYNEVSMAEADAGITITIDGEGKNQLPTDDGNLVMQAAESVFEKTGKRPRGLSIHLNNGIPIGSGLGSSAAATVGGVLAADALIDSRLASSELLRLAVELEHHPDNVAPALMGGLTLTIQEKGEFKVERIDIPPMRVVIVLPDFELATAEARAALPKQVPLKDAIFNVGRLGLLIRAFEAGNYETLSLAMQDRLHQPYRLPLIPGMKSAFDAARDAGARAIALSGAGPSIAAFAPDNHQAVAKSIKEAFANKGLDSRAWILPVDNRGSQLRRNTRSSETM
jgi:homoserine kinase